MNLSSIPASIRAALVIALIAGINGGCYLLQSAQGQLSLMSKREPIARMIAAPSTSDSLRTQLKAVTQIRDFASRDLGLPDNGSYRSYADVGRPYVVWNVVAAAEFSVDPKQWCYPIVGCVAYRGYFVEQRARTFAAEMHAQDLDVMVGGVSAYSTLGHFNDPILNTMVGWNDIELAGIVFHELTHQLLYVPDDSSFNEALATTVEEEGVKRWLSAQGRLEELAQHLEQQKRYLNVIDLLNHTRAELREVYAAELPIPAKRQRKQELLAQMRKSYGEMKTAWNGHAPFDSWFSGEINNAHLASVATYFSCVPGFERELAAAGGNLKAFYRRAHELAKLDQKQRDAIVCGAT